MAASAAAKNYFTFVKGFITEANSLTWPEHTSLDEENFDLNLDGSRRRRFGVDYEPGGSFSAAVEGRFVEDGVVSVVHWTEAGGTGGNNFLLVQVGSDVKIYDSDAEPVTAKVLHTIDLTTHQAPQSGGAHLSRISGAGGLGHIIIVSNEIEPFYITYDTDAETFSETAIPMLHRDFAGVDDSLGDTERPSALTDLHRYNLFNQGWPNEAALTSYKAEPGSVYPSNADIYYLGKDSSSDWTAALLNKQTFGNSLQVRGRFLLALIHEARNAASGTTTVPDVVFDKRWTTTEFFGGRIWYAGMNEGVRSNQVLFSQIMTKIENAGKCYMAADPTSEHISDLVDTDGGVITIPNAGKIVKLKAFQNSLLVFASNGVWQITGGATGFSATSHSTKKISEIGTSYPDGVVLTDKRVVYWGDGGIYEITVEQLSGDLQVESISRSTIQAFYNKIKPEYRTTVKGVYDKVNKRLHWFYGDETGGPNKYAKVLILDETLAAFSKYSIDASQAIYVGLPFVTSTVLLQTFTDQVIIDNDLVQSDNINVVVDAAGPTSKQTQIKLLLIRKVSTTYDYTLGQFSSTEFTDFPKYTDGGYPYVSFVETGHEHLDVAAFDKQIPRMWCFFQGSETGFIPTETGAIEIQNPSGCLVQVKWDWADHANASKYSKAFQAYKRTRLYIPDKPGDFDLGRPVVVSNTVIRGSGRSFRARFESEQGKDMHLLGWTINLLMEDSR